MDPDQSLANARAALAAYRKGESAEESSLMWDAAVDLAEAFEALDGWLSRGGFKPKAWDHEKPGQPHLDFVNNRGE